MYEIGLSIHKAVFNSPPFAQSKGNKKAIVKVNKTKNI